MPAAKSAGVAAPGVDLTSTSRWKHGRMADMRVLLTVSAIIAVGCGGGGSSGPSNAEVLKKHGEGVEKLFAVAEGLRGNLPAIPSGKIDAPALDVIIDGTGNALLVHAEDLADLTVVPTLDVRVSGTGFLNDCAAFVRKQAFADGTKVQEGHLKQKLPSCDAATHIVVVQHRDHSMPTVDVGSETYVAGSARGAVFVFDAETGANVGGFDYDIKTPDVIEFRQGYEPTASGVLNNAVDAEVQQRIKGLSGR